MDNPWKKEDSLNKESYLEMLEQGLEELVLGYGEQAQQIRALLSGTIAVEKALNKENALYPPANGSEVDNLGKEADEPKYKVDHMPKDLLSEIFLLKEALDRCEEQKEILNEEKRGVSAKKFALQEFRKMQEKLEAAEREIERLEAENAELHAQLFTVRKSRDSYCNHSSTLLKEKIRLTQQIELLKEMTLMSLQSAKEPKKVKNLSKYLAPTNNSVSSTPSTPEHDFPNSEASNLNNSGPLNSLVGRHSLHQNPYFASSDLEFSYYHTPIHRSRSAFSSPLHKKSGIRRAFFSGIGRSAGSWLPSLNRSEIPKSIGRHPSESPEGPLGSLSHWIKENRVNDIKTPLESRINDAETQTVCGDSQTVVESDTESVGDYAENASSKSEYELKTSKERSNHSSKTEANHGRPKASSIPSEVNIFKHLGKYARQNTKDNAAPKAKPSNASSLTIPVKSVLVAQQRGNGTLWEGGHSRSSSTSASNNTPPPKTGERSTLKAADTEKSKSAPPSRRESSVGLKSIKENTRKGGWR